jgi:DNA-binding transcriptional LysR family regulator
MMNLYYAFVKAKETGSFNNAVEVLGYTQSAIGQVVQSIQISIK